MRIPLRPIFTKAASLPKAFDINLFREAHFIAEIPVSFPRSHFASMPALQSWFAELPRPGLAAVRQLDHCYFKQYDSTPVEMELTEYDSGTHKASFQRFSGPLSLFLRWQSDHLTRPNGDEQSLYISQTPLANLPPQLQADLPIPEVVSDAGRGDVYSSSLWIGVPPTRTPLHRDPNPNLFVQLAGKKTVRMIKPQDGDMVFKLLQRGIGQAMMDGKGRLRGEEMLVGQEGQILEGWVWDECGAGQEIEGYEVELQGGDGIFIPKGWWHAVRGTGEGINASVSEVLRHLYIYILTTS